jgi:hypothetical protein
VATLRLVVIALIVGLLSFVGVALWLTTTTPPPPNPSAALFWAVLGGLAISELAAYFLLRAAIVASARRQFQAGGSPDTGYSALTGIYFTVTLIGIAMAEGIGLFAAILLLIMGDTRLLLVAGAALAAKLALFPTENRYRSFIQRISGTWPTAE